MSPSRSAPKSRRVGTGGMPRAERERQILEAAGQSFASHGYHGASMDEIARRADVSKPMLYHYFGSKQGLYLAYIRDAGDHLLDQMRQATTEDAPAEERLRAGIVAFFRFVDQHRAGWTVLYQEAASQGGPFAAQVSGLRARIAATIAKLLEDAAGERRESQRAPIDASPLAHAVVGAGESVANWWLQQPEVTVDQGARYLMDVVWLGLGTALEDPDRTPSGRAWR